MRLHSLALTGALAFYAAAATIPQQPPALQPDARYKADILVVVAHPDDETMVTGYLARAVYDQHKRVAVIFGTRGNGGGNAVGNEQAAALGAEREIEARRALASLGIMNVWFLGGPDTPGQDVLRSLETWNHGTCLDQTVRLVRLTRPEVILTWLPAYSAGENHGDHQAAGVLATEAFDMAGDRTAFPEQITAPRDHNDISNLTEGLHPWQPKKIYYFSDALHTDFLTGKGPTYSTTDESPSRKMPYYKMAAEEMRYHLTQGDTGQMAAKAIANNDYKYFREPVRLIFGKSLVSSTPTADILAGVTSKPIPYSPPKQYIPPMPSGIKVELGGPWAFYRDFWQAHGMPQLAELLPNPEVAIGAGTRLNIPVLIENGTGSAREVTLTATAPDGWQQWNGAGRYPAAAHDTYPLYFMFKAPDGAKTGWHQVTIHAAGPDGASLGDVALRVNVANGTLPQ